MVFLNSAKRYYLLITLSLFLGFFLLGYNTQDIMTATYILSGDIKNYGHSFDYLVSSSMLTGLPFLVFPLVKLGINISIIAKVLSASISMLFVHTVSKYIRSDNRVSPSIAMLIGFLFTVAGFFTIPGYYTFELIRTTTTGGVFGNVFLIYSLILFFSKDDKSHFFGLFTFFIHPVLGTYYFVSVLLVMMFEKKVKSLLRVLCLASLCIPLFFLLKTLFSVFFPTLSVPLGDSSYLDFLKHWDHHREIVRYGSSEFLFVILTFLTSLYYIKRNFRDRITVFLCISSFGYLLSIVIFNNFYEQLSRYYILLMPQRFCLIPIILFSLVLLKKIMVKNCSLALFFMLIPICFSILTYSGFFPTVYLSYVKLLTVALFLMLLPLNFANKGRNLLLFVSIIMSVVFLKLKYQNLITPSLNSTYINIEGNTISCSMCSSATVFYKLSNLINFDEVDTIAYVPSNADYFSQIFEDIYSADITEVIAGKSYPNYIDVNYEKNLWERRSKEEWINIGKKYNSKGVLVPKSWRLNFKYKELGIYKLYLID